MLFRTLTFIIHTDSYTVPLSGLYVVLPLDRPTCRKLTHAGSTVIRYLNMYRSLEQIMCTYLHTCQIFIL